jgi:hypothetical protein
MSDPTPPTPKDNLLRWFQWLQAMQSAAETASQVPSTQTLGVFANSTISSIFTLTDNTQVGQFLAALAGKTPFSFNPALIAQSSTFESLLEKASTSAPILLFGGFLESCAGDPFSSMSLEDLSASLLSAVFPLGKTDPAWVKFMNGLTSIPASCFSATQQTAVTNLLAKPTNTVDILLKQLIKLG